MKDIDVWQSKEHPEMYDTKAYFPFFSLRSVYKRFNEFRLLNKFVAKDEKADLLEVGCATGELYRYFRYNYPNLKYTGCDVSASAIERAKVKYPGGKFSTTDRSLSNIKNISADYIFSRDVVLHQEDPFGFLTRLCSIPQKGLILRLRTRDIGATELNIEKSCQLYLGGWIPYIIFNCDELISHFKSLKRCSKIVLIKNYMALGGLSYRYLPKDCYISSTGIAETALYIELSGNSENTEVIAEVGKDGNLASVFDRLLCRIVKGIMSSYAGRVWW